MRHRHTNSATRLIALLAASGLCTFGACDIALGQTFEPARLIRLKGVDGFRCPVLSRESPMLFCQVLIDNEGNARRELSRCFGTLPDDVARGLALKDRFLGSEFEPASIDGKTVEVFAPFRVFFNSKDDACNITVSPNLGVEQNELGLEYFAPQEVHTDGGWIAAFPPSDRFSLGRERGVALAMSVAVDELGQASDGRVEHNYFVPERAANSAVRALEASRFIPLTVNGEPRPGRYFEFIYAQPSPRR